MSYKTVLVHMNDVRRMKPLLEAAAFIARRSGSHLVATSIVPPVVIYPGAEASFAMPAIVETHRAAYRAEEAELAAGFDAMLKAADGWTGEWRSADAGTLLAVTELLLPMSRSADLLIASQADPGWHNSPYLDVAEVLATDSGRPVLIIPNAPAQPFSARRIIVAWDGSREASRAAFDALPLLRDADAVTVATFAADDAGGPDPTELAVALARHGVACSAAKPAIGRQGTGEALLAEASRAFDLLVMGCYGHSRLREFILGGASRHVLARSRLPILMSH